MFMFAYIRIYSLNVKFLSIIKHLETEIKLFVADLFTQ